MKTFDIKEILDKLKRGELVKDFKLFDNKFLIFKNRNGKWKMIEIKDDLIFYKVNKGWSVTKSKNRKNRK